MKVRITEWYNHTGEARLFGVDGEVRGAWSPLGFDHTVFLADSIEEAEAFIKELQDVEVCPPCFIDAPADPSPSS